MENIKLAKRWLFLDDDSNRHDHFNRLALALPESHRPEVMCVRTVSEAVAALSAIRFDCVWLDHDLEMTDPHETGQTVAEFIALHQDASLQPRQVVIHSHNPDGAQRMFDILRSGGVPVKLQKFTFP